MSEHIFPAKLADFNNYIVIAIPYLGLVANTPRLISAPNQTALTALYSGANGWTTIYPLSIDETTATKTVREQRDTLRAQIEAKMHVVFEDIAASALTSTDRDKLHLHARDTTLSRAVQMGNAPHMQIGKRDHLVHTLVFDHPSAPGTKAMPEHQRIVLESYAGAAALAADAIAFANARTVTRASYDAIYTEGDVGKTAYYRCCYENTHGERSPWSVVVSGVIG